jgi:Tol biopolymer transport system component
MVWREGLTVLWLCGCHVVLPLSAQPSGPDQGKDTAPPEASALDVALSDNAPPTDAPRQDLPGIDPLAPFVTVAMSDLSTVGVAEDDPTLTGDMLEIYFERGGDIWFATRTSVSASWVAPQKSPLSSASTDSVPEITPDGLTIVFGSDRPGGLGSQDLYIATRGARSAPWSAPSALTELNSSQMELGSCLSPDRLTVFFGSDRSGDKEIYSASRTAAGLAWPAPTVVQELSTPGSETAPWVSPDLTVVYFASDRPGGQGGPDLWVATTGAGGKLNAPVPVSGAGVNTSATEGDPWLSPDLRTLYFSRNGDIYLATR